MAELGTFDVAEALAKQATGRGAGRFDMETSSNCYIAVFRNTKQDIGEKLVHSHPDSDQILFVLDGQCVVWGLNGKFTLNPHQGVLVPGGVNYGFSNERDEDLIFLSLRTEATGGRRVAYVPGVPSDALVRLEAGAFGDTPLGRYVYAYIVDRRTVGLSPILLDDWNRGTMLRANCDYEQRGNEVLINLPERIAGWFRINDLTEADYHVVPDPDGVRVRLDLSPLIDRRALRAEG